jgi:hypothetical protein
MRPTLQLDVPAADAEFHRYASAIAAGRFLDAADARATLEARTGIVVKLARPGGAKQIAAGRRRC